MKDPVQKGERIARIHFQGASIMRGGIAAWRPEPTCVFRARDARVYQAYNIGLRIVRSR
jgi:hypothetical protein